MSSPLTNLPAPDFRSLFEAAPGLYLVLTPNLKIAAVSNEYLRATMTVREEILGRGIFEVFPDPPGDASATGVKNLSASLHRVLDSRASDTMAVQKYDIRRPDTQGGGFEERYWSPVNSPVLSKNGEVTYIIHRVEDVTEFIRLKREEAERNALTEDLRSRAEKMEAEIYSRVRQLDEANRQLREANDELATLHRRKDQQLWEYQNRLALIVDSSHDAIIGKNLDGIITSWNKGAERIYGYTSEEAIGRSVNTLVPAARQTEIAEIMEIIRRGGAIESMETVRLTKDGKHVDVSISVSPIRKPDGEIVGGSTIARDISQQKRTERQFRQAQKMEALGRLAGGIAHDFNNILGIVTSCTELLSSRVPKEAETAELMANIFDTSKRGAALTRQLLSFSRRQPVQPVVLDLNQRLRELCKLLRPLMGDDITVTHVPHSQSPTVEADPGQIDQVVLNLAVNARDAMPRGGKFVLETGVVDADEGFASHVPAMKPGHYVVLAVTDNGCGMDESTRLRLFEPFFTTKDVGKGTGLGLATVYGIVQQSGGHIWVYSEPERGTTFKIYLPSAAHKLESAPDIETELLPPKREGVTILLVEDDAVMRRLTRLMIEEHGYKVLEAEDGNAALDIIAANHTSIDLTLTDVAMKGMNGPDLTVRIAASHPAMKFIFMSGYTGDLLANTQLGSGIPLVEKPFTRATLLQAIESVLA